MKLELDPPAAVFEDFYPNVYKVGYRPITPAL